MLTIGNKYNIDNSISYGDKSITHRALILASIASDNVTITNASLCDDCLSTIDCISRLGAYIDISGNTITVGPIQQANSGVVLNCGNSGTTARLIAGLVAGLGIDATLVGDDSLSARPMDRVIEPLVAMGAHITTDDNCIMHLHSGYPLHGIQYHMPVASAQVKSALLLAGLFASGTTTVIEDIPTRDHTEIMLQHMGVECINCSVVASVPQANEIDIPNDMSCAIYGIVLALFGCGGIFGNVGINSGRMGAIGALVQSGANITLTNKRQLCGEWRADIEVLPSQLQQLQLDSIATVSAIDDILPLAVVASRTSGTSTIAGIAELAHKESNRIQAIVDICTQIGAKATVEADTLNICGVSNSTSHITVNSQDHRVAMTAVVAGLLGGGASIGNYQCMSVSCPQFTQWLGISYYKLALIGGSVEGSLSPIICNLHSRASGINTSYDLLSIADIDDNKLLELLDSYHGCNVTMPYKSRVAKLLASKLDSVNTVCGSVTASTDGIGMTTSLAKHNIQLEGANILVIGAGGASMSVCRALQNSGANIYVVNRTTAKADVINNQLNLVPLDSYNGIVSCVPPCSYELTAVAGTTPQWIVSVSYRCNSHLKAWAEQQGAQYIGGLGMLYYQAQASYNIWFDSHVADCMQQLEESK